PPAFNLSHDQTLQLKIVCVTSSQAMCYCSMNSVVIPTEADIALHSRYQPKLVTIFICMNIIH
ncbi:hypothetical protein, partial [Colwellia echini]|uniref:hypothetical protein n=1 Tax=Colwellia echini TaxID=1982103 RepID=UPI001B884655